jgi:hypothetical protein
MHNLPWQVQMFISETIIDCCLDGELKLAAAR